MADFISLEAALACFHDWIDRYGHEHSADEMAEYQRIEELPAADARPVVKCLECENALRDDSHKIVHCNQNGEPGYVWCKKEGCCRAEDFFCANGVSCSCGAGMREVDADGES